MRVHRSLGGVFAAWLVVGCGATALAAENGDATRGTYIFRLGGCDSCHTDAKNKGAPLSGGLALKSPFGTFYTPNITPDPETGIGNWSTADFIRAMTEGVAPDGAHYYPSFPYTSYARMTRRDLTDLKAYLDTVKPIERRVRPHDMQFPFNIRTMMFGWKLLFFRRGSFEPNPRNSAAWNRGAYIVNALAHCGECHSARNFYGATSAEHALSGTRVGPEGKPVPNITPHRRHGIGEWSKADIVDLLETGGLPDGDSVGGAMREVVDNGGAHWTAEDRAAVADYLMSLPARATP